MLETVKSLLKLNRNNWKYWLPYLLGWAVWIVILTAFMFYKFPSKQIKFDAFIAICLTFFGGFLIGFSDKFKKTS